MTLHQKVEHLIGRWAGADAGERSAELGQLAKELIDLVKKESDSTPRRAPASSAERVVALATNE